MIQNTAVTFGARKGKETKLRKTEVKIGDNLLK